MPSANFLFSIVTPTYNAEKWLDMYFQSLVNQKGGIEAIQIIIADDGSTDSTSKIAQSWVKKYPQNIFYYRKENGGLSSARNFGLSYASGEWITFIDPDDFVCDTYFQTVRGFIENSKFDGHVIGCNLILFDEKTNQFWNHHPLSFKFKDGNRIIDLSVDSEFVQLSVASSFIRAEALNRSGLRFDVKVRPTFEDAHLLNKLFIHSGNFKVACLSEAVYFYRKRILADSLVSFGWSRPEKYKDQVFYGYLDLLNSVKKEYGSVPEFIQNLVVYEAQWYINRLLDLKVPYDFTEAEFISFLDLMRLVFKHIEPEKIFFTKLPMLSFRTRTTILSVFKNQNLSSLPFQVLEVSPDKNSMLVVHYSDCECQFSSEGKEVAPLFQKKIERKFKDQLLCVEQMFWLPINDAPLTFEVDGQAVSLLSGGELLDSATQDNVCKTFYMPLACVPQPIQEILEKAKQPEIEAVYKNCWLFSDRVDLADDNAEHLYRWVADNAPSQNIYFVIKRQSPDWGRLSQDGFKLIAHGSEEHHLALCNAEWVVSSHMHHPVMDPLGIRRIVGFPEYKFAFIQHGIILHDMSDWVNSMKLDIFITTTKDEYDSILYGNYISTERELVLAGLPRHDALISKRHSAPHSKLVLVCPTWRDQLCNPHTHSAPDKAEAAAFMQSDYYKAWNAVTSSNKLSEMAKEQGYRFLFLPHPYSSRVVDLFEYSERFTCKKYLEIRSVQDLLASASLLITDYSSLSMEAALIGLPVVYYQFMENPSLFALHTWTKGYFEYEKDGFGPVTSNFNELCSEVEQLLKKQCERDAVYSKRARNFFTMHDGKNCSRVYEAIRSHISSKHFQNLDRRVSCT